MTPFSLEQKNHKELYLFLFIFYDWFRVVLKNTNNILFSTL